MCPHQGDDPRLASRIRRIHDVEIRVHHTQLRPPGRFRSPLPLHIPKSLPRVLVDRTVDLHGQPVPAIREVRVDPTATRGSDLDISLPPGEAMVLQHEPRIGLQRRVHSDDRAQQGLAHPADAAMALEPLEIGAEVSLAAKRRHAPADARAVLADHTVDDGHELLVSHDVPTASVCRCGQVQQCSGRGREADRSVGPEILGMELTPMPDNAASSRP